MINIKASVLTKNIKYHAKDSMGVDAIVTPENIIEWMKYILKEEGGMDEEFLNNPANLAVEVAGKNLIISASEDVIEEIRRLFPKGE